jgi:hypothetical protein
MIAYRDTIFCTGDGCMKFGSGCKRSLTESVKAGAARWWGGDGAPISVMGSPKDLPCYVPPAPDQRPEEVAVS